MFPGATYLVLGCLGTAVSLASAPPPVVPKRSLHAALPVAYAFKNDLYCLLIPRPTKENSITGDDGVAVSIVKGALRQGKYTRRMVATIRDRPAIYAWVDHLYHWRIAEGSVWLTGSVPDDKVTVRSQTLSGLEKEVSRGWFLDPLVALAFLNSEGGALTDGLSHPRATST